ncbi:MAG: hypothetical protein ABR568_22585 [Pyrinomonadaceae bacterium]
MKDNICQELSLGEMARAVNLSPSRLWRMFKAETGEPDASKKRMMSHADEIRFE